LKGVIAALLAAGEILGATGSRSPFTAIYKAISIRNKTCSNIDAVT
jgi:hypothetical protein